MCRKKRNESLYDLPQKDHTEYLPAAFPTRRIGRFQGSNVPCMWSRETTSWFKSVAVWNEQSSNCSCASLKHRSTTYCSPSGLTQSSRISWTGCRNSFCNVLWEECDQKVLPCPCSESISLSLKECHMFAIKEVFWCWGSSTNHSCWNVIYLRRSSDSKTKRLWCPPRQSSRIIFTVIKNWNRVLKHFLSSIRAEKLFRHLSYWPLKMRLCWCGFSSWTLSEKCRRSHRKGNNGAFAKISSLDMRYFRCSLSVSISQYLVKP